MLYAADRAEHVRTLIGPALQNGSLVLCDRFADSSMAFQGYGRGLDLGLIENLNRIATSGLQPDLTILLDLDPALAALRLESRISRASASESADRFDREARDFHNRVRDGYLRLCQTSSGRIRLVDSSGQTELVQERIRTEVQPLIDELKADQR
jgi:dTMP kinase